MIDAARCKEIAGWSLRMQIPGVPDVRAIVDYDRPEGEPFLDKQKREARFHPTDFRALRNWADAQLRFEP
jgi:hypothetical protein